MKLANKGLLFALIAAPACAGEGTVTVTAYGESFIEDGIPADEVEDGWAVEFERFDVTIRDVVVGGTEVPVKSRVNLASNSKGKGHSLGSATVTADDHTHSSFSIGRVEVTGRAMKGDVTKTFEWVFDETTSYHECETTTKVPAGGEATFQITVHADHLLYDSLVSEEPRVVFQALADADADDDGVITKKELAATDIGAYDPGSEDGVDDLWSWLVAQTRTLGHVDGEGHCHATAK